MDFRVRVHMLLLDTTLMRFLSYRTRINETPQRELFGELVTA